MPAIRRLRQRLVERAVNTEGLSSSGPPEMRNGMLLPDLGLLPTREFVLPYALEGHGTSRKPKLRRTSAQDGAATTLSVKSEFMSTLTFVCEAASSPQLNCPSRSMSEAVVCKVDELSTPRAARLSGNPLEPYTSSPAEAAVPPRVRRSKRRVARPLEPSLGAVSSKWNGAAAIKVEDEVALIVPKEENLAELATPPSTAAQDAMVAIPLADTCQAVPDCDWQSLGVPPEELDLGLTLPTGQTFRWRQTSPGAWTGVVRQFVVSLRQTPFDILYFVHNHRPLLQGGHSEPEPQILMNRPKADSPNSDDAVKSRRSGRNRACGKGQSWELVPAEKQASACVIGALEGYFNIGTSLAPLWESFAEACPRFAALAPYLRGARMLRQDPLECLCSFICSSNNHISRITGMVEHLTSFGTPLATVGERTYYAFPTLDQLSVLTEEGLRASGFGYRAKYVVGTVQMLQEKPGSGVAWLESLRSRPLAEAVSELCTLPGVGPKVAACIALFSLEKHEAIPVDTHVWQLAVRYYMPQLADKTLTLKIHQEVADVFVKRFGPYAGWALNAMFIAELAFMRDRIPGHLLPLAVKKKVKKLKVKTIKGEEDGVLSLPDCSCH